MEIFTAAREAIVREAESWLGTPYVLGGQCKGAGADCFTFIAGVMAECGLYKPEKLPAYSHDWWAHQTEQNYILHLRKFSTQMFEGVGYRETKLLPGTIAAVHQAHGRAVWHGGIVSDWPRVLHCCYAGVEEVDATKHSLWALHKLSVFDPLASRIP